MMSIMAAVLLLIFNWKLIFFESFNFVLYRTATGGKIFATFRWFIIAKVDGEQKSFATFCVENCSSYLSSTDTRAHGMSLIYGAIISSVFLSLYTTFFRKQKFSFSTAGVKAWSSENLLPFSRNYISLFATKYLI